ncbi:hypothetical protein L3X38_021779 [Prunus dulcis]|uniref:Wall-associated receptor kinase galacturonan-binding domain-containing protein n=1 Tax=Prunus dulcis TaxID=3755 RepID=A0AAD4VUX6_PRUDU|nr:hypothetical protein L3X38_021779 [Prunus dulcis]
MLLVLVVAATNAPAATRRREAEDEKAALPQIIRPHCQPQCGNLTVPYPFGICDGCYLQEQFNITCNDSTQPPTPQLMIGNLPVTSITLKKLNCKYCSM